MGRSITCECGKCRKCLNRFYQARSRAYAKKLTKIKRSRLVSVPAPLYPINEVGTHGRHAR